MIPSREITAAPAEMSLSFGPARAAARTATLILSDVAAFALVALLLRSADLRLFGVLAALIILLRACAGLLPGHGLHPHEIMRRSVLATLFGGLAICAAMAAAGQDATTVLFAIVALPLQHLARLAAIRALHAAGVWGAPVHILAPPDQLAQIEAFFRRNWHLGFVPTVTARADTVLVTENAPRLHEIYPEVIVLADLPQLRISGLRPADVQGAVGLRLGRARTGRMKRACDLAIAVPALVFVLPVIALAAAAIWIADPGPVFYAQEREGQGKRSLRVLKLRTMYRNAERILQDVLDADPQARAEWDTHFKLRKDPRILPVVGHFLRASSCDELPQLLNVIAGGMSLVGPRPFPDYHLSVMRPEFRAKRCTVPPGITGLWQISSRSDANVEQQQQLDEFYIDNRSFWLDASILLRTVPAVLLRHGAY